MILNNLDIFKLKNSFKLLLFFCFGISFIIYYLLVSKLKEFGKFGFAYLGYLIDDSVGNVCSYIMNELYKSGKYKIFLLSTGKIECKINNGIKIYEIKSSKNLEKIIKKNNIKIVYHNYWSEFDSSLKQLGVKIIGLLHTGYFGFFYGYSSMYKQFYRLKELDVVIHQIEQDYYLLHQIGINNLQLMPNYLTYDVNKVSCAELKYKNLILIGRDQKVKFLDLGIKALSIIVKKIPEAKMYIITDNPKRLLNLVQILNLEQHTIFIEKCNDPSPYLKNSSLMLYTSEYEGFSQVIGEGLSYCLPVITNNLFYLQLSKKYVINTKTDDYIEMAEESIKLLDNFDYRYNISMGIKYYIKEFSHYNTTKKWIKLIDTLLEGEKSTDEYFKKEYSNKDLKMFNKKSEELFKHIKNKLGICNGITFEDMIKINSLINIDLNNIFC